MDSYHNNRIWPHVAITLCFPASRSRGKLFLCLIFGSLLVAPTFAVLGLFRTPQRKIEVKRYLCGEDGSIQSEVVKILSCAIVKVLPKAAPKVIMGLASMTCYFMSSIALCAITEDIESIIKPIAFSACVVGVELIFHAQTVAALLMIIAGLLGDLIVYVRVRLGMNLDSLKSVHEE